MTRVLSDVAQLLGQVVPHWALVPTVVLLALVALPFWIQSIRGKQIAGLARRMVRAEGAARAQLIDEIFGLAGTRPALLRIAIEQAIRYDHRDLRTRAMKALEATGKGAADLTQLRAKITPETKPVPHPLEVAVNVERLIGEGLLDTARLRLDEALARYPDDADLNALRERLRGS